MPFRFVSVYVFNRTTYTDGCWGKSHNINLIWKKLKESFSYRCLMFDIILEEKVVLGIVWRSEYCGNRYSEEFSISHHCQNRIYSIIFYGIRAQPYNTLDITCMQPHKGELLPHPRTSASFRGMNLRDKWWTVRIPIKSYASISASLLAGW